VNGGGIGCSFAGLLRGLAAPRLEHKPAVTALMMLAPEDSSLLFTILDIAAPNVRSSLR